MNKDQRRYNALLVFVAYIKDTIKDEKIDLEWEYLMTTLQNISKEARR